MTIDQILILGLLVSMLVVFARDWFRVEVVALVGLAIGIVLHLVPFDRAFSGLANPAVITVLEILLIVEVLKTSHLLDGVAAFLSERLKRPHTIMLVLCGVGALLSTVMNNIGAFSLMLPMVFVLSQRHHIPQRLLMMPLSFATLMGGMCTVVGTPPNLVVSEALLNSQTDQTGTFRFLDFLPTGVAITIVGLGLLVWWAPRILKSDRQEDEGEEPIGHRMVTEVFCPIAGKESWTVETVEAMIEGQIDSVLREERRLFPLRAETGLKPDDRLLVEADEGLLKEAFATGSLTPARSSLARSTTGGADQVQAQAAIMPFSILQGSAIANIGEFSEQAIRVIGVATQSPRVEGSLDEFRLSVGDILHLEGQAEAVQDAITNTGLVSVVSSGGLFSARKHTLWTSVIFLCGLLAAAFADVPPEIAYGMVLVCYLVGGMLDMREALKRLNWPIILLLMAMLPLGEAVATTGAAETIAKTIIACLPVANAALITVIMMALAVCITPFVNNATTAVVLVPIAIELAHSADLPPALLLMAVAIGASCDFLTPFGHHNNLLAYALGPYRFREFFLVGWPVTLTTIGVGSAVCLAVWS
nr:SLC13 family permease [uncultured Cohaesibacter sp.]